MLLISAVSDINNYQTDVLLWHVRMVSWWKPTRWSWLAPVPKQPSAVHTPWFQLRDFVYCQSWRQKERFFGVLHKEICWTISGSEDKDSTKKRQKRAKLEKGAPLPHYQTIQLRMAACCVRLPLGYQSISTMWWHTKKYDTTFEK